MIVSLVTLRLPGTLVGHIRTRRSLMTVGRK